MSINPSITFDIWAIDFIGPLPKLVHRTRARYIILVVEYVKKWVESHLVEPCTKEVAAKFIYENMVTRFGCPITLISDRGSHFINQTIEVFLKEFNIDHHKISTYHLESNGAIESFNKNLTKG